MRSAHGKVQRQQRRPGRVLRRVRGDLACGAQRQAIHDRCSQGICYVPMGRSWGTGLNFCICWRGVHLQGVGTVAVISARVREKGVAACEANLDDGNRASAAASPRQRTTKPRMQPLIVQDPRNEVLVPRAEMVADDAGKHPKRQTSAASRWFLHRSPGVSEYELRKTKIREAPKKTDPHSRGAENRFASPRPRP